MDAKKPIPAAVQRAIDWALVTACFPFVSLAFAYALVRYDVSCSECVVALTDAQNAEVGALWFGMLCCAVLQAAAAALALLLPCGRRALAHLALAITIVGHYMYAVVFRLLLAAGAGFLFSNIFSPASIVLFAGGDLVYFLGLLQGGGLND
ncbi:uncharacterized protein [Triticum aestivum]|uniref:uncharacterized protein isoform X1 n=1 Tax=Triticum aestivum TaxID=4565 RepID=UPI001D028C60|nr:uncharacterized protein LOC123106450 isoform X1 [Triticum aestivum]XP_044384545.1 uncharacterized protein LOC123106450 isoform X1 [Triticum aestivum]